MKSNVISGILTDHVIACLSNKFISVMGMLQHTFYLYEPDWFAWSLNKNYLFTHFFDLKYNVSKPQPAIYPESGMQRTFKLQGKINIHCSQICSVVSKSYPHLHLTFFYYKIMVFTTNGLSWNRFQKSSGNGNPYENLPHLDINLTSRRAKQTKVQYYV